MRTWGGAPRLLTAWSVPPPPPPSSAPARSRLQSNSFIIRRHVTYQMKIHRRVGLEWRPIFEPRAAKGSEVAYLSHHAVVIIDA